MIAYLKGKGYKPVTKDTLNNKEFRLSESSVELDEDVTTFGNPAYLTIETYELFLSTKDYSSAKVQAIVSGVIDENEVITCSTDVEIQERGYLITITFNIKG